MTILPKELLSSLDGLPGFDRATFEAVHADGRQVTAIRVNPGKWGKGVGGFEGKGFEGEKGIGGGRGGDRLGSKSVEDDCRGGENR
ncbi:MAG TPA: hypothetical protein VFE32_03815, partial [Puia sp.]|nr:hypothetical protein [Puia sp.]